MTEKETVKEFNKRLDLEIKIENELISEFVEDLKELEEWIPELYRNLKEKWEKKLK